nr:DUF2953 domain-containing protein [Paenibacillus bovis]
MYIFLMIVLCIIAFTLLILIMNIKFEFIIKIHTPQNTISLKIITLYGLVRIKREFQLSEFVSKLNEREQDFVEEDSTASLDTIFPVLKVLYKDIVMFIKKIKIYILEWSSQIGLGDAASSAIGAGTVWSIKGTIIAFLQSKLNFKRSPEIKVIPDFQGFSAQTYIKCMLKLKAGNAIWTGYKVLKTWKKYRNEMDTGKYDHIKQQVGGF